MSWTDLGDIASLTYPQIAAVGSTRTVCNAYTNGWLTGVTDAGTGGCPGTTTLATLSYYPNHMVSQVAHGNGVTDSYDKDPNDIGRPARIATSNVLSAGNWISGTYQYDGAGSIKAMRGMTEPIGRPAATGQLYGYDAFGNLTSITTDGSAQTIQTDATTNRLSSSGYDNTGNLTAWGGYAYTYDAFNAMATLTGGGLSNAYTYDAAGERISAKTGTTGPTTYSLRGLDGKVLRDYTLTGTTWSWSKDYAYRAGQLLATIDASGTKHMSLDHLGSPRLITNGDRSVATYHAYWAYGMDLGTDLDAVRMKFTGHERDNQTTAGMLDYMHARYYSPVVGRFLSIDPVGGLSENPQSWNRYAYVLGNPITLNDPTGRVVPLILVGALIAAYVAADYANAPETANTPTMSNRDSFGRQVVGGIAGAYVVGTVGRAALARMGFGAAVSLAGTAPALLKSHATTGEKLRTAAAAATVGMATGLVPKTSLAVVGSAFVAAVATDQLAGKTLSDKSFAEWTSEANIAAGAGMLTDLAKSPAGQNWMGLAATVVLETAKVILVDDAAWQRGNETGHYYFHQPGDPGTNP